MFNDCFILEVNQVTIFCNSDSYKSDTVSISVEEYVGMRAAWGFENQLTSHDDNMYNVFTILINYQTRPPPLPPTHATYICYVPFCPLPFLCNFVFCQISITVIGFIFFNFHLKGRCRKVLHNKFKVLIKSKRQRSTSTQISVTNKV